MAKKSEILIAPESKKKSESLVKQVEGLNKTFGSGFSIDGAKDLTEEITLRYPVGLEDLDLALGGDNENASIPLLGDAWKPLRAGRSDA